MEPLVTVFIPVYNSEKYIKQCLDSVVNQTYRNLEILIIDDGSTDNSINIIKEFYDDRIRILQNKGNKGLPYTRNKGLREAQGKYFATLDSDDIAIKTRIEKQVSYLEKNNDIDVLTSNYQVFSSYIKKNIINNKEPDETKIYLMFGCHICNSTSMIRLQSVKKYGISYNLNCFIAQDYELWTQFSKHGKIDHLSEILVKYRMGHENITKKTNGNKKKERKQIISNIKNELLSFYGFDFNENEKKLFNDFFGESIEPDFEIRDNINALRGLFKKISIHGEKIFGEKFKGIFYTQIKNVVINSSLPIKEKISLLNLFLHVRSHRDIFNIIKRTTYLKMKNSVFK
jgi:glycosyltransferase involved in cell wall biosynthesis